MNCVPSVSSLICRRFGFDVEAQTLSFERMDHGYTQSEVTSAFKGLILTPGMDLNKVNAKGKNINEVYNSINESLKNNFDSGNFGMMTLKSFGTGHDVYWELTDKGACLLDAQTGKALSNKYLKAIVDNMVDEITAINFSDCEIDFENAKKYFIK